MSIAFQAIVAAAILSMLTSLIMVFRLRRIARGGKIGRVVNGLAAFVVVFTLGYFSAPFFPYLPESSVRLIAAIVFLFGALFVIIVLRLIEGLVRQVLEELRL